MSEHPLTKYLRELPETPDIIDIDLLHAKLLDTLSIQEYHKLFEIMEGIAITRTANREFSLTEEDIEMLTKISLESHPITYQPLIPITYIDSGISIDETIIRMADEIEGIVRDSGGD